MSVIDVLEQRIKSKYGFTLKEKQREVLYHLSERKNVAGLLPTGYGKSVCFWAPSVFWGWRVWVISPLLSLMNDQRLKLRALGVHSWASNESLNLSYCSKAIFFMTPEFLTKQGESFYKILEESQSAPDLIVFDEAHCLSDWRFFRPAYLQVANSILVNKFPHSRFLFLSATLSSQEIVAWEKELGISLYVVRSSFLRKNLYTQVMPLNNHKEYWCTLFACLRNLRYPQVAILYAYSRREVESVYRSLGSAGFSSCLYHAGLPKLQKEKISREFSLGKIRILCATSAFGMGIDYPHVERIIHLHFPTDITNFWQQSGRAGRAGQNAISIILWKRSNLSKFSVLTREGASEFMYNWISWSKKRCRLYPLQKKFQEKFHGCNTCDFCVNSKIKKIFPWLPEQKSVWWLEKEAKPVDWIKEKHLEFRKALDDVKNPDSVLSN